MTGFRSLGRCPGFSCGSHTPNRLLGSWDGARLCTHLGRNLTSRTSWRHYQIEDPANLLRPRTAPNHPRCAADPLATMMVNCLTNVWNSTCRLTWSFRYSNNLLLCDVFFFSRTVAASGTWHHACSTDLMTTHRSRISITRLLCFPCILRCWWTRLQTIATFAR